MMKTYRAASLQVQLPATWLDGTTYVFAGPPTDGFSPNVVASNVTKALAGGLEPYIDAQLKELQALPEFTLLSRARAGDDRPAALVFEWKDPKLGWLRQRQHYCTGQGQTYAVTATQKAAVFDAFDPLFQIILASFQPLVWEVPTHG